jgi:cytochrome c-type biogenesis protein CcmH/NrfG
VGVTLQIFAVLVFGFAVVTVAFWVGRRTGRRNSSAQADFAMFSHNELERLKSKGLLSDEEVKKVQSVVSRRTVEAVERSHQKESEPAPDLNSLLMEAERYRREISSQKDSEDSEKE